MTSLKLKITVSALALCLASTAVSAEDLRFTVWTGNEAHLNMLKGIADGFEATHDGVTVTFETIPAGDYIQKLTFQLAGGNPPDLGWMFEDSMPAFVAANVVAPLTATLEGTDGYDLADFSEPAMGLWKKDDEIYGVPFSTSPFMIYYNKDMFDAAGLEDPLALAEKGEWTMAKFREVSMALTKPGERVWGFEFKDGQGYDTRIMHAVMPAIRANGGDAWANGECGFDKPEAVEAIQTLHDMVFVDKSIVPPGEQGDYFSGASAMTINQISRASKMPDAGFNWGIAPLPSGPGGESPVIGQAGLVVFSKSQHVDLAKDFIAWMTNKENVAVMAQFFPPARASVLDSDAFTQANKLIPAEQMKNVAAAIKNGKVLPSHQKAPQILAAQKPRFDALWRADADVNASIGAICDAIKPQL
ncbi:sugar ABC transporter substrate-binding protein [Oricola sp.]|uniref:ABC transporter substrate-binding protein n=1 Tax=Oricola sp. TaxID=1979950 RepID=UPI0025EED5EC|nr:sugar ABC transporter substrate-binding protein [Oricola sp.]MCI5075090.1 sugar ABC transporter substrate-binding protein [Oricola sp.]